LEGQERVRLKNARETNPSITEFRKLLDKYGEHISESFSTKREVLEIELWSLKKPDNLSPATFIDEWQKVLKKYEEVEDADDQVAADQKRRFATNPDNFVKFLRLWGLEFFRAVRLNEWKQVRFDVDGEVVPEGAAGGSIALDLRQLGTAMSVWYRREYVKAESGAAVGAEIVIDAHLLQGYANQVLAEAKSVRGGTSKSDFVAAVSSVEAHSSKPPQKADSNDGLHAARGAQYSGRSTQGGAVEGGGRRHGNQFQGGRSGGRFQGRGSRSFFHGERNGSQHPPV
jgi:hypothetical protein